MKKETRMTTVLTCLVFSLVVTFMGACSLGTGSSQRGQSSALPQVNSKRICSNQLQGNGCWTTPSNQPACYIWTTDYQHGRKISWSGKCSDGFAQGAGILTSRDANRPGEVLVYKRKRNPGEKIGAKSISLDTDSWVSYGTFVNGRKDGNWHETRGLGLAKFGPYKEGYRTGQWVEVDAGQSSSEGSYMGGRRHGQWVHVYQNGETWIGSYLDGLKHGEWNVLERGRVSKRLTFLHGMQKSD